MNFSYGSFSLFSKIQASVGALQAALGGYFLDINLQFSPHNPPKGALVVHDLELSVSFGDRRQDLGLARPAPTNAFRGSFAIRRLMHGQHDISASFRLHLATATAESLEHARNAGDAVFHLGVQGNITGYDSDAVEPELKPMDAAWSAHILMCTPPARVYAPEGVRHDLDLAIPESKWIDLLGKAGFTKTFLLEVPVLEGDELGTASNHIRNAQLAFAQGRYADVVARCRDALDSIIPKPDCPWAEAANRAAREKMTVEDGFRLSWCAVRQITHATHHRNNLKSEFTRPMAQYVLGATCLTLSLASRERDLFAVPRADE